jgi:hypothetical protein
MELWRTMKLAILRQVTLCLVPLLGISVFVLVFPVDAASEDSNRAGGENLRSSSELLGGWNFVRTRNPNGGADAVSIMRTADTMRSDLDLAGLVIRCTERRIEAAFVVIRAFSLRARPHVVFGRPENETRFEATVVPPGMSILVSADAAGLVGSSWRTESELFIRVEEGPITIRGVIPLMGLQSAFEVLAASCPAQ